MCYATRDGATSGERLDGHGVFFMRARFTEKWDGEVRVPGRSRAVAELLCRKDTGRRLTGVGDSKLRCVVSGQPEGFDVRPGRPCRRRRL